MKKKQELLSRLPSVNEVLQQPTIEKITDELPRRLVIEAIREVLDQIREEILATDIFPESAALEQRVLARIKDKNKPNLSRVINGTGVVLHTNLGRAVLSKAAVDAVTQVAQGYSNLEYDLMEGERGSRYSHIEEIICRITGAPAAMVVNNNAAAVLLVLSTVAKDKEAIVSRGELVEIGGSFRVPEVMSQSGAILKEVGATNKTYIKDYESAINENTGVLLKVHTSNYRVVGFTHEPSREELVTLGKKYQLPVVEDLGSGSIISLEKIGLNGEPTVAQCLKEGIDVVTFSGDKLLGGPQAGIIVGNKDLLERIKRHPLARAIRVDKMTVAALEATLRAYMDSEGVWDEIPTLKMLEESAANIKLRAESLQNLLAHGKQMETTIVKGKSKPGGGSLPTTELDTWLVVIDGQSMSAAEMAARLRQCDPPVIIRIQDDKVMIDPRTLQAGEEKIIAKAMDEVLMG